jgi:putative membrane protein
MMCSVPTFALAQANGTGDTNGNSSAMENGNAGYGGASGDYANNSNSSHSDNNGNSGSTNLRPGIAGLLQRANDINQEEQNMAGMLKDKAGDNQALKTFAATLRDDHRANENALQTLANQENVNLNNNNNNSNQALKNRLDNLNGGAFNAAFLNNEIREHRMALSEFEQARNQNLSPDMRVYIDQTIPVLRAHLEMAEALKRDMRMLPSHTSQANNSANSNNNDNGNGDGSSGNESNSGGNGGW